MARSPARAASSGKSPTRDRHAPAEPPASPAPAAPYRMPSMPSNLNSRGSGSHSLWRRGGARKPCARESLAQTTSLESPHGCAWALRCLRTSEAPCMPKRGRSCTLEELTKVYGMSAAEQRNAVAPYGTALKRRQELRGCASRVAGVCVTAEGPVSRRPRRALPASARYRRRCVQGRRTDRDRSR